MPLSNLNQEQLKAATTTFQHNLIIASAGTGKTSTIVGRIAYLIKNGTNPRNILLLTFTNKAGQEMIARLKKYFGKKALEIQAGTFHSLSYRWLKEIKKITLKRPKELKTLLRSIYENRVFHNIESETKAYTSDYLYDLYSLYLNSSTKEFGEWLIEKTPEQESFVDIYVDILDEFQELKQEFGYVNFDDLLLFARDAIKNRKFNLNFQEILVDEYQDTNPLQNSLINAIKYFNNSSLFCVGDYDQSIYAFNGSDINIIATFNEVYQNSKIYTLNINYRSTNLILELANKVISRNERLYPKKLEVFRTSQDIPPILLRYEDLYKQYEKISNRIKDCNTNYEDIAIIFRNNSSADGIEVKLRELEIPSKRKGSTSFFDSKDIQAILDATTLIFNQKDMMAFLHLVEYAKGIGASIGKEIFDGLMKVGDNNIIKGFLNPRTDIENPFKHKRKSYQLGLFDDISELQGIAKFQKSNFDKVFLDNPILKHPKLSLEGGEFIYKIYTLIKETSNIKSPSLLLNKVFNSNMFQHIRLILANKRATLKDGTISDELKDIAKDKIDKRVGILFHLSKNYQLLSKFLNAMILGGGEMGQGSGVNLLTVHASKGLEFKDVYIVDLAEGRFPNSKLMNQNGGGLDEERRLFYVAVTRAKDRLFLSFARNDNRKNSKDYKPSTFLKEAGLIN